MAKIKLAEGFTLIPEGTHVFKVVATEYKSDFDKVSVTLETANGLRHTETYNLSTDGGIKAFSYFAKCALNDFTASEIDPSELIGHYIEADVTHDEVPKRDDPSKTSTFARLNNKRSAVGFTETPTARPTTLPTKKTPEKGSKMSLNDLLDL